MKKVTEIQMLLTLLAITVVLVTLQVGSWLASMPESDPVRQSWQSRLDLPGNILWYGVLFPWLMFSVLFFILAFLHMSAWILRRLSGEDDA
jgi:hypothetical protein